MTYIFKDQLFEEKVKPLLEEVKKIIASGLINVKNMKKTHAELVKVIDELKNDEELLVMLALVDEEEIEAFYKNLTESTKPSEWDWEEWETKLDRLIRDLKGKFTFGDSVEEYNLNGGSLRTVRVLSNHFNLEMTLHGVKKIILRKPRKHIEVEVIDMYDNEMATWHEYDKIKNVEIERIGSGEYRYGLGNKK
ncbi:hypothetical protein BTJ48_00215 [Bacillus mycoides]|uniref:hypothetical protein n=1 Tax=Bacillus mycoides TaxID=1405 RepID=UPI000A27B162|nr:hypothetical protein [Bacillus mycoides]OSY16405.1 hypothetical protein BTJ48_00215 [Bacillus mycoides]